MAGKIKAPPGYIGIGRVYISGAFLLKILLSLLALAAVYAAVMHPIAVNLLLKTQVMPEFKPDSPYLSGYTGKARITKMDGTPVYEGEVELAAANGEGRLFDRGRLVYEGRFENNMYSGRGRLYGYDGNLIYDGDFAENEFSGRGRRYKNGELIYEGGFFAGEYNGEGTQYENGAVVYTGGFEYGVYSGAGKQYDENGRLLYDGQFSAGKYDGAGRLYQDGSLIYEGEFLAGAYSGTGSEYDAKTGRIVFSGKYLDNLRMEAGVEYDENGEPVITEPEPVQKPEPTSLLGIGYTDALTQLTQAGAALKEQAADGEYLVIDEVSGVIYVFPAGEDGVLGAANCVYYYGLLSAGGIVVGADISDIGHMPVGEARIGAAELLALGYSNALWGRDVSAVQACGLIFNSGEFMITAYYLPPEPPQAAQEESAKEEEPPQNDSESGGGTGGGEQAIDGESDTAEDGGELIGSKHTNTADGGTVIYGEPAVAVSSGEVIYGKDVFMGTDYETAAEPGGRILFLKITRG